jgi:hypothetical protein
MSDANLTTQTPNSENDKLLKGLLDFRMPTSSGQVSAPRFPLHSLGGTSILPFLQYLRQNDVEEYRLLS